VPALPREGRSRLLQKLMLMRPCPRNAQIGLDEPREKPRVKPGKERIIAQAGELRRAGGGIRLGGGQPVALRIARRPALSGCRARSRGAAPGLGQGRGRGRR
jgi:hypothetical protein